MECLVLKHNKMYLKLCFLVVLFSVVYAGPLLLEEQEDFRGKRFRGYCLRAIVAKKTGINCA